MKQIAALFALLCLLLTGCSQWMEGSYSAVVPHSEPSNGANSPAASIRNDKELKEAIVSAVRSGAQSLLLSATYAPEETIQEKVKEAVADVCQNDPFAAYAVEEMKYTFGTNGSQNAVSIQITYLQNRVQMSQIRRVDSLEQAQTILAERLDACEQSVVLYFPNREQADYAQMVEDYALAYPQRVMEVPEVTVRLYPEKGEDQIAEIKFSYQTSREELRALKNKVAPVFTSASQYAAGEGTAQEKAARLYTFLMERYEYSIQTSITPAYSLLVHGVGDQRAFAVVYGAMCRQSGLDCRVVTGTRGGEPWVWNVLQIDGDYYYLDLLRCSSGDGFCLYTQEDMPGYVWDYSAYAVSLEKNP